MVRVLTQSAGMKEEQKNSKTNYTHTQRRARLTGLHRNTHTAAWHVHTTNALQMSQQAHKHNILKKSQTEHIPSTTGTSAHLPELHRVEKVAVARKHHTTTRHVHTKRQGACSMRGNKERETHKSLACDSESRE